MFKRDHSFCTANNSRTLNTSKRLPNFRPNSSCKRQCSAILPNTAGINEIPPPLIMTMPNNQKKTKGMGNKFEPEELYCINMQLKETVNKLKQELAEEKSKVVKRENELRKKEKIIKDCHKENDLESVHKKNINKAKESTLLTLCKEKYYELQKEYENKCKEVEILNANIKITQLKEYKIEIDVCKKEMNKLRNLYHHTIEENNNLKETINNLNEFKRRYKEQHNIINSCVQKCEDYNNDILLLQQENDILRMKLNKNEQTQQKLKTSNAKLKINNEKFLRSKQIKENYNLLNNDNAREIIRLEKELNEYKDLFQKKDAECKKLIESKAKYQTGTIDKNNNAKPFDYNQIVKIEDKGDSSDQDKLILYKSLYEECQTKLTLLKNYLISIGVNPEKILSNSGFDGVINPSKMDKEIENSNNNKTNIIKNNFTVSSNFKSLNGNGINLNSTLKNKIQTKESNQINFASQKMKSKQTNELLPGDIISPDDKEVIFFKESGTNSEENKNNESNNFNNGVIDDDTTDSKGYELKSIFTIFIKNFEANKITKEMFSNKLQDIFKIFENREDATQEEFIQPFIDTFVEFMKIKKKDDIDVVETFMNEFLDYNKKDSNRFIDGISNGFEYIVDYRNVNEEQKLKDIEESFGNNKEEIIKKIKEEGDNENHLINYVKFLNIIKDIDMSEEEKEFLLYKMKCDVPEGNSIFDLNYEIIEKMNGEKE